MKLSPQDFGLIRDLLYERTGLMFEDKKLQFLESRVVRRLTATKMISPRDYYRYLKYSDKDGVEFQALIEQVTTNETYFFREYPQLECFANAVLPKIAEVKRKKHDFTLNVWSACCSTGDEAYTLAIILHACLDDFVRWDIRLLATDIDRGVLATAKAALYDERNVKDVAPQYLSRYFTLVKNRYLVNDQIRKMVTFEHLNLMDKSRMQRQRGFDFVFCRNALIYFDDDSRREVLSFFYDALVPGGYVFLGHAEAVSRFSSAFEPVTMEGSVIYRKPLVSRALAKPVKTK